MRLYRVIVVRGGMGLVKDAAVMGDVDEGEVLRGAEVVCRFRWWGKGRG